MTEQGLRSTRVWLLADRDMAALEHVKALLEEEGASVELLDLGEAIERAVREQGGKLIEGLRVIFRRARGAASEDVEEALGQALDRGRPDVIVVAADRHLRGLDVLARMAGGGALRVGLLPDYNLGASWLKGALQAYIVPHEQLKPPLLNAGIGADRIFVAGPPVPRAWAAAPDRAALRASFGLSDEGGPVVMVLADGIDGADVDKLIFQTTLVEQRNQPIFYAGADVALAEGLRRAARRHGLLARMLGAVPNLHDFIAASDLVALGAQDGRVVSVLATDRPVVLVGDPGAVTTQVDFLKAQGVACHVTDLLRFGGELEGALRPDTLAQRTAAAGTVGHPTGSAEVVAALRDILARREELGRLGADPAAPPGEETPAATGPFEMIGASTPEARSAASGGGASAPPPGPFEGIGGHTPAEPTPLSAAEAKDELAALIMEEREQERRLEETRREQETWRQRLELARDWNEAELAAEAEERLRTHVEAGERAERELERVRAQKEKLKARVRQGGEDKGGLGDTLRRTVRSAVEAIPGAERRFRDMEIERDLDSLRSRLKKELGE